MGTGFQLQTMRIQISRASALVQIQGASLYGRPTGAPFHVWSALAAWLSRQLLTDGTKRPVHLFLVIEDVRREAEAVEPAFLRHLDDDLVLRPQGGAKREAVDGVGEIGGHQRRRRRPCP